MRERRKDQRERDRDKEGGLGRRKVVEGVKMDSSASAVISLHYPINPRTEG